MTTHEVINLNSRESISLPNDMLTYSDNLQILYSETGSLIAGISKDNPNEIIILHSTTFEVISVLSGHTSHIMQFEWAGDAVVTHAIDGSEFLETTVRFWEPLSGTLLRTFQVGFAGDVTLSPDNSFFAISNFSDNYIEVRDSETGEVIATSNDYVEDVP